MSHAGRKKGAKIAETLALCLPRAGYPRWSIVSLPRRGTRRSARRPHRLTGGNQRTHQRKAKRRHRAPRLGVAQGAPWLGIVAAIAKTALTEERPQLDEGLGD